jgi:heme/copper-type cytochrome/quinol oxidase subunit 2
MVSPNMPPRQTPAAMSTSGGTAGSYVDWAVVLAGGVLALAVTFLLMSFGASLGLSLTSPYRGEGVSASWLAIAAGIWFVWVVVTAFGAGGYLAGRMRRHAGDATADEVEMRDGAHGLLVWATGALVSTVLATMGATGVVSMGASAVGSAVGTVSDVAGEAVSSDYFANVMLRGAAGDSGTGATEGETTPPDDAAADDAGTAEPSGQQPAQPTAAQQTAAEVTGVDPAVQQEIAGILTRGVASGEIAERDRSYLARLVAANSDLDEDAARTRVDEVTAEIDEARATAIEAVEQARVAGVVFGFIATATLLLGAVAASLAAAAGGRHRDAGLGLDVLTARR